MRVRIAGPKPEFDIMEDGMARGFEGDDLRTREFYRTMCAVSVIAKELGAGPDGQWDAVLAWKSHGVFPG